MNAIQKTLRLSIPTLLLIGQTSVVSATDERIILEIDPWEENDVETICEFTGAGTFGRWLPCWTLGNSGNFLTDEFTTTPTTAVLPIEGADTPFADRSFYLIEPATGGSIGDAVVTEILTIQTDTDDLERTTTLISSGQSGSLGPIPPATPIENVIVKTGFDAFGLHGINTPELLDETVVVRSATKRLLSNAQWRSSDSYTADWAELACAECSDWVDAREPYPNPSDPSILMPNTAANYIWHDPEGASDGGEGPNEAYFRLTFELVLSTEPGTPVAGVGMARIAVDDDYELYVNGELVFANRDGGFATVVDRVDFTPYLRNGTNVIAIHAVDGDWFTPFNRSYEFVLFDGYIYSVSDLAGDFNNDLCVDRSDLTIALNAIRNPTEIVASSRFDLNGDGVASIADVRWLVTAFSTPRGEHCRQAVN